MKLNALAPLTIGMAALSSALPVCAATLDVVVDNVRNAEGHILAAVCREAEFLSPHCGWVGKAPARPGAVTVPVNNVPPGVYAVQVFHDENDNMKIDRNFLGIPEEGMAFSNDAPFRFGPPSFAEAAISLSVAGGRIVLRLRYF